MDNTFNETYEILSLIAEGGMSRVFLAKHRRLQNMWAVKVVDKHLYDSIDFLAESNILKRLNHPMLPKIIDIFVDDNYIKLVEEYVNGKTLDQVLRDEGDLEEATVLQWYKDLCDVLSYLHNQNPPIIYRDMKPSNIMIQPDGSLKLIDFGIAREYKSDATSDTTYVGTRGYAAPEQFGTAQTDARTDIYSLGVTMYHLMTGKSPFEPPYDFVPVRQLKPNLSPGSEFILNKCVQKEPENRYQNVEALRYDLDHIYVFGKAWGRYLFVRRARVALIVVMLAASIGMIFGGHQLIQQENEDAYTNLLAEASSLYLSDYDGALSCLAEARELFPDRVDADRQETYAMYLNGKWQDCITFGQEALDKYGSDMQTRLTMASAQFEIGEYEDAAEGFAQGGTLSADNMRDYAVCLGRLGRIEDAERILQQLTDKGAHPDVTQYVQGEVFLAQKKYVDAESAFLAAMDEAETDGLTRRCYVSLSDLYRECSALVRTGSSPIEMPATKAVNLLTQAVTLDYMRYDTTIWEALGLAYFESYHIDTSVPQDYLKRAGECFNRVIELGVSKDYLYRNLYTIYYELGDYTQAEDALERYEEAFPQDYMPHALRAIMQITIENDKPQNSRNYQSAMQEYQTAGSMIRSTDDTTYYQQLESLVQQLRSGGWI